jgi:hypothetical protein
LQCFHRVYHYFVVADFNRPHKSTEQHCAETVTKPKVYTSIYKDVRGEEINPTQFKKIYWALDWQLVDQVGDYYKVPRARPIPRKGDNQNAKAYTVTMEYLPNNAYSYE